MKKKWPILSTLMAATILVSCADGPENPGTIAGPDPGDPTEIVVNATTLAKATRVELGDDIITSEWQAGDKIGVFMNFKDNWNQTAEEYSIQYNSSATDKHIADFKGGLKWQAAGLPHTFYGYYFRNTDGSLPYAIDATAVPISLPDQQKQDAMGYELDPYNFMVALPMTQMAPRDFNAITEDNSKDKIVDLEFKSAFSIIEFRFASFEGRDDNNDEIINNVIIEKVTIKSDNRILAVSDGTIDITKPLYDNDLAKIQGGTGSDEITVTVTNGTVVPRTPKKKNIIFEDSAWEPNDPTKSFPVRMIILPNISLPMNNPDLDEEKWTVTVETTWLDNNDGYKRKKRTYVREYTTRTLKPGERHAIPYVLETKILSGGSETEDPGIAWDGVSTTKPNISGKVIEITTPAELAWVRDVVNGIGSPENPPADNTFKDHILRLMNNIDLKGYRWIPIGYNTMDADKCFQGNVEGQNNLISNMYVVTDNVAADYLCVGLFGNIGIGTPTTKKYIKDLRVNGNIEIKTFNINQATKRVGGIVGSTLGHLLVSNCSFEGVFDVDAPTRLSIGGIGGGLPNSTIDNCHTNIIMDMKCPGTGGDIKGTVVADGGGIYGGGAVSSATISNSSFTGSIRATGNWNIGGIAGVITGNLSGCKNTADLYVDGPTNAVGGIAAQTTGVVTSCYNWGNITCVDGVSGGGNYMGVGGVLGATVTDINIKGCYSYGKIEVGNPDMLETSGHIIGYYYSTFTGAGVLNNYYHPGISGNHYLPADRNPNLSLMSIRQFTPSNWPRRGDEGWEASVDGKNGYWNSDYFPPYSADKVDYPQLWWEIIE